MNTPADTAASITLYQCGTCGRYFDSETAIRAHQDAFQLLHGFDPEIDEHDGEPWVTVTLRVGDVHRGCAWFRVLGFDTDEDGVVWTHGNSGLATGEVSLCPRGLAGHLSGDREMGQSAGLSDARTFAAALALELDSDDPTYCLREHLHNRELAYAIRQESDQRMQTEMCWLSSAIAVFAAQRSSSHD